MTSDNVFEELQEYIIIESPSPSTSLTQNVPKSEYKWCQNDSKVLIDLYSKYRKKMGTLEIKNTKMFWQKIADELGKLNINVTPNNCLNRWRVLERNYKKFIDNQNKTGRGRKYFEYETEMGEIFGKKKNVHPDILLSSDTVDNNLGNSCEEAIIEVNHDQNTPLSSLPNTALSSVTSVTPKKARILKKKSAIENLRIDRKLYYDERLKIEKEKLEELRKRNRLIEERNLIIKENLKVNNCQCQSLNLL